MRIDTHAHYFPAEYFARLLPHRPSLARRIGEPIFKRAGDLNALLESMHAGAIDHALIGIGSHQPYLTAEADATALAMRCNDAYADSVARHPRRLSALGCVPLPHVDAAVREANRCMIDLRFKGIVFGTKAQAMPLDDPLFEHLWAELDHLGAIAQIHPSEGSSEGLGLNVAVMGPNQICIACARLAISGVTTRYPNIRFIAPCMGGGLPFYMARIERFARHDPLGASYASEDIDIGAALRGFYYDTESVTTEALRCTCDVIGIDRIIFGTNHPFESMEDDAARIASSGLVPEQVAAIMDHNPSRLLDMSDAALPL